MGKNTRVNRLNVCVKQPSYVAVSSADDRIWRPLYTIQIHVSNISVEDIRGFRISNASYGDSPTWRRESQPSRDFEFKLTQLCIVLVGQWELNTHRGGRTNSVKTIFYCII